MTKIERSVELSKEELEHERQRAVARQQLREGEGLVFRYRPEAPWEKGPPEEIKSAFDSGAVAVFQTTDRRMIPVFQEALVR